MVLFQESRIYGTNINVPQGCALGPILFSTRANYIITVSGISRKCNIAATTTVIKFKIDSAAQFSLLSLELLSTFVCVVCRSKEERG